jgi:hypothetical protein
MLLPTFNTSYEGGGNDDSMHGSYALAVVVASAVHTCL